MAQHAAGHDVVVLGFSQSASVATAEMRYLASLPADLRPGPDQLSFVLLGDPNNPNGGLLARFPGLFVQPMGLTFSGATPSNLYPTTVYTRQYDGFADFPQYPLNIPADLNALLGIYDAHGTYQELTPAQVAAGVVQPVSPADVYTTYILHPSEQLPLLEPLRGIVARAAAGSRRAGLAGDHRIGLRPNRIRRRAHPRRAVPDPYRRAHPRR